MDFGHDFLATLEFYLYDKRIFELVFAGFQKLQNNLGIGFFQSQIKGITAIFLLDRITISEEFHPA